MKFDVIVGNPPYQGSTDSESGKNWQPIWPKFLTKAFDLVNPNGYVAMVTPRTWASGSRNPVKSFFKDKTISYLNMNVTKYFNIVSDVSAYILKNCKPASAKGKTNIIDIKGQEITVNMRELDYLPFNTTMLGLSIFEKTVLRSDHYSFVESKNQINSHKGNRIIFLAGRNGSYKGRMFVETTHNITKGIGQMAVLGPMTDSDALLLEATLKLNLYIFLFDLLGGNRGLNRTWILNSIPKLNFKKKWTNKSLYKHFGLTQEEIDYIEATVK